MELYNTTEKRPNTRRYRCSSVRDLTLYSQFSYWSAPDLRILLTVLWAVAGYGHLGLYSKSF